MKYIFILDGLNCANCAAKIENRISKDNRFSNVSFSFASKQLVLYSDEHNVKSEITKIVNSIEDGVTVVEKSDIHNYEHVHPHDSLNHKKLNIIMLIIATLLFAASFIMHLFVILPTVGTIMSIISAVIAGHEVFIKGVKSITKLKLDETSLMAIAVVAAMILGEFVEAAAVTVMFSVGELLEDYAVNKSRRDISKLANIREDMAVIESSDGTLTNIPAQDVAVGSEITIKPYARVPLDSVVISGESYVDSSALSGESIPVSVYPHIEILSGMVNGENTLKVRTTKLYTDSAATRIIRLVEESAQNKGNSERLISRFARIYTPVVMVISILIAIIPGIITGDYSTWIYRALVCLVSSCPCAVVISVPLAYFAGIGASSKSGVLIKGGKFVEVLAKADCIAFDKTGTLTTGKMSVTNITTIGNYTESDILKIAASCEKMSSHPVALAIKEEAKIRNINTISCEEYYEKAGFGVTAKHGNNTYSCGGYDKSSHGTAVFVNDEMIGTITITDTIRKEAKGVISALRDMGIKNLLMLTGDNEQSAKQIADNCCIDEFYHGLLPQDKTKIIKQKSEQGSTCCFVGDGINDAPVMACADCGIAMGLGSDAAIESSDVVLSGSILSVLPKALRICRRTISTIRGNIIFALSVKAAVIVLAAVGIAPMWLAVFADTGVSVMCIISSTRLLKTK